MVTHVLVHPVMSRGVSCGILFVPIHVMWDIVEFLVVFITE